MAITLSITDRATPILREKIAALVNTRPLMAACGKRVQIEIVNWFRSRQQEGNRHGWTDRNFWFGNSTKSASKNVKLEEVTPIGATVHIDDPRVAHKIKGGTIRAKRGKYLAIPLTAEAYAAGSPRERNTNDLECIRDGGRLLLVTRSATLIKFGGKRKDGSRSVKVTGNVGGEAQYLLVRSVTQPPDYRALPPGRELQKAIHDEAADFLLRLAARN